ncbi:Fur family transcriptional regulator [Mechercharimyces sp. CAU 1602]|uniref:Fur family transcriptional regulator n=1 Tax=Mechercharimyces sp. CAU 1602 TaxID=2973933 RepID=UPI0021619DB3|nr:Fur family transcriptional regulator [Mechercharimyces sp. CAU 1602]MCS1352724.1 transcriptional repressor [Mechercharimyces sp. CAU 1602]
MKMEQALERLKKRGYKYTGKREAMVRIFAEQDRYLTAKEMVELMQEEFSSISLDTVYRNLALFEQLSILEATEWIGERRYRLSCNEHHHHHHHLICTECGRTRSIRACPMDALLGEPDGFAITGHKFEIYGICKRCEA